MATRSIVTVATLAALVGVGLSTPAWAQDAKSTAWSPARLADGQPDIRGMWNNIDALSTPLQLPDGFSGPDFSPEDLEAIATARAEEAARRAAQPRAPSVGAYGAYWFDSFWNDAERTRAPALIVEPLNGQIPDWTVGAHEVLSNNRKHVHEFRRPLRHAWRDRHHDAGGVQQRRAHPAIARIRRHRERDDPPRANHPGRWALTHR